MLEQLLVQRPGKAFAHFFHSPERAFYVRELARLVEGQLNAIRRELANLERWA